MASAFQIAGTLGFLFALHKAVKAYNIQRSIGWLPGHRDLLGYESILYWILPSIKGLKLDEKLLFAEGYKAFEKAGWDAISAISFWPSVDLEILLADAAAYKDIATTRRFPKPLETYECLNIYGQNIVSTEGELWKKYRRISAPSFSETNLRLVWSETFRVVDDLIENVWNDTDATVAQGQDIALQLALLVLGSAIFGQPVAWEDHVNTRPKNHLLTFRDALHTMSSNLMVIFAIPDWAKSLHPKLRKLRLAENELRIYMQEMIRDCLDSDTRDKHDLFSNLVNANKLEKEGANLTEEELMGNIFVFLVAGHETTAHALSFAFAALAVYPEVQEKMLKHIKNVIPDGRRPTYEDMANLNYVLAVYYETLRLYSPVSLMTKIAPEDTSIVVGNSYNDKQRRIPVSKGTKLTVDIPAVHRNPKYWERPDEFNPERFLGDWNKDALVTFSVGPRACLGRRFNETESIAALTAIVSRYKIEIQDEPQFRYETLEQRRERIFTVKVTSTLVPKRLPLVFRRRTD